MKNREHYPREHHPLVSLGLFFIILGIALLTATNDLLGLGSIREYFTWQTALIFIGLLLIVNLRFTGGILLTAAGTWFMLEDMLYDIPPVLKIIYWPGVIILLGISFIISYLFIKKRKIVN